MNIAFREHPVFSRVRESLFGSDEGYRLFQNMLLQTPDAGDVIQGTGGVRKVRWSDPGRGKGKRSGIRILYIYVEQPSYILLIAGYNKNQDDLTPEQKRAFRLVAEEFRQEIMP